MTLLLSASCAERVTGPPDRHIPEGYPPRFTRSVEDSLAVVGEIERFNQFYGTSVRFRLTRLTYRPRYNSAQGVRLDTSSTDSVVLAASIMRFVALWRDLLGIDPERLTLVRLEPGGVTGGDLQHYAELEHNTLDYPVAPVYRYDNTLRMLIAEGEFVEDLSSSALSEFDLTAKPQYSNDDIREMIIGEEVNVVCSFEPVSLVVEPTTRLEFGDRVLYPRVTPDTLEIRLCREVGAGTLGGGSMFTFYYDVVNGEKIAVWPNFYCPEHLVLPTGLPQQHNLPLAQPAHESLP